MSSGHSQNWACVHVWHLHFCGCQAGNTPWSHGSGGQVGYVCRSYSSVTNGETVLNCLSPTAQQSSSRLRSPAFLWKRLVSLLTFTALAWEPASNYPHIKRPTTVLYRNRKASRHHPHTLTEDSGVWKRIMCTHPATQSFCGYFPEDTSLDSLALVVRVACVMFNRTVAKKEFLPGSSPQGSVQTEHPEMPISQSSPERGLFSYFKSCCLGVWLPE